LKAFLSPAKINLFLHVHRKRADDFHDLSSLFQTIDLYDRLYINLASHDVLTCSDPSIATNSTNLVSKAIALFRTKTDLQFSVSIHLEKNIPHQAGLGGGSSNAATTLWALNQLLETNISIDILREWASELGSDVPFFLTCGTAYCTGRGELMNERPPLLCAMPLTIVKPPFGISTKEVFQNLNTNSLPIRNPKNDLIQVEKGEYIFYNDLEIPAFQMNPKLNLLKDQLVKCGYSHVCMTGSGSSLFCFGEPTGLLPEGVACYLSRFVNRTHECWFEKSL